MLDCRKTAKGNAVGCNIDPRRRYQIDAAKNSCQPDLDIFVDLGLTQICINTAKNATPESPMRSSVKQMVSWPEKAAV